MDYLQNKTTEEATLNVLEVHVDSESIGDIYQIGKTKTVILELNSFKKKTELLKNGNKLKGSGVFISPDLTREDRLLHKALYHHLKEARSRGKNPQIRGNKLIVDGRAYTLEELEVTRANGTEGSTDCQHEEDNAALEGSNFVRGILRKFDSNPPTNSNEGRTTRSKLNKN